MLFRVVRVLWFMFCYLFTYSLGRLRRDPRLDAKLEIAYRRWAAYVLEVFDVEMSVEGREHLPPEGEGKLVICSNHQSECDIPALVHAMGMRVGFVAKKELASIPLLNYWMRQIGCVFIDRSDKKGAHRALEQAAESMGAHPLVVFPEGTRSKDGNLLPAKIGGFRLAQMARAQVLPVLIQGTRDAVENRAPGADRIPVRVRIFPPFDAGTVPDGKEGLARIKDYVEACWRGAAAGVPRREDAPAAGP